MRGIRNTTSTGRFAGRRIAACAVIGLTGFLVVVVPARVAQAATDVVTNCSGAPASVGSLPYEVANATSGDTVTFALSPACSTIMLSGGGTDQIQITKNLTITGPGAGLLTVEGDGGQSVFAVYAPYTATISGLTVTGGGGGGIGGVYNSGTLTLSDDVITGNSSTGAGGGIYNGSGMLTVTDSIVSDNTASSSLGGGILNTGTAVIDSSTVAGNSATIGAGIMNNNGVLTLENSTVANNTASSFGGGLTDNSASTTTITDSTITGNTGAGIDQTSGSTITVGATVVAGNPVRDCSLSSGTYNDLGDNLSDDATCNFTGTGDQASTPAGLDPSGLRNNGGPTPTIALFPGSAAIDHVASGCPAKDQRSSARTAPCDIGAFDTDAAPYGPIVANVTPATGYTTGGIPVTITGSGFTGATAVDFAGVAATGVTVNGSGTSITATSPSGAAGVTDVTVVTPSGTSAVTPADQFTYTVLTSPTTSGCSPSCSVTVASPLNGTRITVTGASTSPTAKVKLVTNTQSPTNTLNCGSSYSYAAPITTLTPTGFATNATVTVSQTLGNQPTTAGVKVCFLAKGAATPSFLTACHTPKVAPCLLSLVKQPYNHVKATFLAPAKDPKWRVGGAYVVFHSFSPTTGTRLVTSVSITGTNLTPVTAVTIGGAVAKITSVTATKIVVTVPQNARTGLITLSGSTGSVVSVAKFTVH